MTDFPSPPASEEAPRLTVVHDHPSRRLSDEQVRTLVRAVVEGEGAALVDLSIVLSDHATVHRLNREYLSHDYITDVLSFSLRPSDAASSDDDAPLIEGEVYVDLDTAAERCDEFGASFEEEALRYVVHGVLHLVGYDDKTDAGANRMHQREDHYVVEHEKGLQDSRL